MLPIGTKVELLEKLTVLYKTRAAPKSTSAARPAEVVDAGTHGTVQYRTDDGAYGIRWADSSAGPTTIEVMPRAFKLLNPDVYSVRVALVVPDAAELDDNFLENIRNRALEGFNTRPIIDVHGTPLTVEVKSRASLVHFECFECGQECFDSYMVHDAVWREVMNSRFGYLHVQCLETRLGRELRYEDFTDKPVNDMIRFGMALETRRR